MRPNRTVSEVVGANVATLRRALGLSQEDLARAMALLWFRWHRQSVAEVEAGRRPVSIEEVAALGAYFGMRPEALIVAPGIQAGSSPVRVGATVLTGQHWAALWQAPGLEPPGPVRRAAIDLLVGKLERPWARLWRRGAPGEAFVRARDLVLGARTRHPGPIFLLRGNEPLIMSTSRPPWAQSVSISLIPGEPYVARDEIEAELLGKLAERGRVRRISRQQAWKLRKGAKDGVH
ncbi:hypothetical protein BH20ACT24_BH20ACT24_16110 [soil metagenome]